MIELLKRVFLKFTKNKLTLSLAESCTGGLLGDYLTQLPGSSTFFFGGIIAYHNTAKTKLLKVPQHLIQKHGAVSAEVAIQMAQGARKAFKTDIALSITGIAGPNGASSQKPVGLVYISLSNSTENHLKKCLFKGNRRSIKRQACETALKMLAK